jgi:hypothetical protein
MAKLINPITTANPSSDNQAGIKPGFEQLHLIQNQRSLLETNFQKTEKKFNDLNVKLEGNYKNVETLIETQKQEINETLKNYKSDFDKKIDKDKFKVVELLGIFVALFTFVSVDFQLFKSESVSFTIALSLVLITAGILLIFILTLEVILNPEKDANRRLRWLFMLAGSLIFFGICGYSFPGLKQLIIENNKLSKDINSGALIQERYQIQLLNTDIAKPNNHQ